MMSFLFKILCLSLLKFVVLGDTPIHAQEFTRKVSQKLLFKVDMAAMVNNSFSVSNNRKRFACRVRSGKKQMAVIDGIRGKVYDSVTYPIFSPDSRRVAYAAKIDSIWILLVDDKVELSLKADSSITAVLFSPDSKSFTYVVNDGHKYYNVFGISKGRPYDDIDVNSINFSTDSRKVGYMARKGKKQLIVYDGHEGNLFDQVGFPVINSSGNRIAYRAIDSARSFVILDNMKSPQYDDIKSILFSPDGKRCAYIAARGRKQFVVLDGIEGEKVDVAHSICFSPDGTSFVYGIDIMNGKEGPYQFAIVNGERKGPYLTIVEGSISFSADSRHLVYKAEADDTFMMVLDGKNGKDYGDVLHLTAVFSPDNLRFAYVADNNSKRFVIEDGKELEHFNDILFITFSPDSKRLAYAARLGDKDLVVLDGNKGGTYSAIMGEGGIVFDSPGSFHYLAMKDNDIYLVEESVD